MGMNLAQLIRQLCDETNTTVAELSRRTGQSQQNLGRKLNKETLGYEDFLAMLDAMGVKFEYTFIMPGGDLSQSAESSDRAREKIALLEAQVQVERQSFEYRKRLYRDIRTALYTIKGNADIARKHGVEGARVDECVKKINEAGKQIDALLTELMNEGVGRSVDTIKDEELRPDVAAIKGKRVLVVDDNELNREITRDTLLDNGMVVDEAPDGRAALDMVARSAVGYYSCVLMDIQMPGMDGLETTAAIRCLPNRMRANVPIIAMTANAFEEDKQKSFESGMDAHLTKPLNAAELIRTIVKLV